MDCVNRGYWILSLYSYKPGSNDTDVQAKIQEVAKWRAEVITEMENLWLDVIKFSNIS